MILQAGGSAVNVTLLTRVHCIYLYNRPKTSQYSAETGRLIPPPSRAMSRGPSRAGSRMSFMNKFQHITEDPDHENMVRKSLFLKENAWQIGEYSNLLSLKTVDSLTGFHLPLPSTFINSVCKKVFQLKECYWKFMQPMSKIFYDIIYFPQ